MTDATPTTLAAALAELERLREQIALLTAERDWWRKECRGWEEGHRERMVR